MTWILQVALAIEGIINILEFGSFLLYPDWCLSFMVSKQAGDVPASAAILLQTFGVLVLALTYPVLALIPNNPGVFHKRKIIFETFAAGEIGLISLWLWHWTKAETESGFAPPALLLAAGHLVPALIWHNAVAWLWPSLLQPTDHKLEMRKRS